MNRKGFFGVLFAGLIAKVSEGKEAHTGHFINQRNFINTEDFEQGRSVYISSNEKVWLKQIDGMWHIVTDEPQ